MCYIIIYLDKHFKIENCSNTYLCISIFEIEKARISQQHLRFVKQMYNIAWKKNLNTPMTWHARIQMMHISGLQLQHFASLSALISECPNT